ncbi:XF1762 family protein [Microbacterium sp. KNMS]
MSTLRVHPISLRQANEYIASTHRHHGPVRGHKFSVAVVDEHGEIRGVGVAGRPVSRMLDSQGYIEVVRVATDGTKNACSMLYGALRRAAVALGYPPERIITYTLSSESGGSLKASGWVVDGETSGGSWSRPGRPRIDAHPTEAKTRWRAR